MAENITATEALSRLDKMHKEFKEKMKDPRERIKLAVWAAHHGDSSAMEAIIELCLEGLKTKKLI